MAYPVAVQVYTLTSSTTHRHTILIPKTIVVPGIDVAVRVGKWNYGDVLRSIGLRLLFLGGI